MFRYLFVSLLLVVLVGADARAQTRPNRVARKKTAPYSVRKPAPKPAANINPHTGKPYGAGVSQDLKDGSMYLAPSMPMRKQVGYQGMGAYNDNRKTAPATKRPANSSLSRENNSPKK